MSEFYQSVSLLLALLNPFLVIIYLIDVIQKLDQAVFGKILLRAGIIASTVFCSFALGGEYLFTKLIHVDFASFRIFGGIVFLLIGLQFFFQGPTAVEMLRGDSNNLAGAIAMPVLIGPGTISASVVVGRRLDPLYACGAIVLAVAISIVVMIALKAMHDHVKKSREELIQHYIEVAGRVSALYVGTVSVDMIMRGILAWSEKF